MVAEYNFKGTSLVRATETHDRRRIRPWVVLLVVIVLISSVTIAWRQGIVSRRHSDHADQNLSRYVVGGISMVPTLFPQHLRVRCDACRLSYAVDESTDVPSVICFHCGGPVEGTGVRIADIVSVQPVTKPRNFEVGEMLLIRSESGPAIKRIFAVGNQTVDIDGLNLINQDHSGSDISPVTWIPVHHDPSRPTSRWKISASDPENPCLVYHHISIHDHHLPSPIYDDVPFNAGLSRRLFLPTCLRLQGRYVGSQSTTLRVAGWIDDGEQGQVRSARIPVAPHSEFEWTIQHDPSFETPSSDLEGLTIPTDKTPLVIYSSDVTNLRIDQAVTYRLRPGDDDSTYPKTLSADELFVVGDNVPVSIDSRNYGPIQHSEVLGIVRLNHSIENRQFEFQND
jgi:Signal peptidase, peptidase S26